MQRDTSIGGSNLYGLGAVEIGPYANHTFGVSFDDPADPGAGAGGGAGDGGGSPITLSDDAMIVPPGGGTPVKYADYMKGYRPAADFTTLESRTKQGQEFLLQIAQNFDKLLAQGGGRRPAARSGAGGGGGTGDGTSADLQTMLKSLRGEAVLSGEQVVEFFEKFNGTALEPLMKTVTAMALKNQQLEKDLKGLQGSVGRHDAASVDATHGKRLDTVLGGLKLDAKHEPLRDLADFVYRAHVANAEFETEYPAILKNTIEGLRKFFRAELQKEAETARTQQPWRRPIKAGGNATPNGKPSYAHQSGLDIAKSLFHGGTETRT